MNKKAKRLMFALCALVLFLIPLTIYAATSTGVESDSVYLLQEGSFDESIVESAGASTDSAVISTKSSATVGDTIYEGLLECNEEIVIYSYGITGDEIGAVYTDVVNHNPDLFYVSSTYSYKYNTVNDVRYVYSVIPRYSMSLTEISDAKVIFDEGAEKALSMVDDSMTDIQKCLVLHDYLCDLATYPDLTAGDKEIYHSAYGVFYDGYCVCAGYALTYSYLLNSLGIECEYVLSSPMTHAWNSVKIGNNWYNVDLTYDDIAVYNDDMNTRGAMYHACFMKSDAAFSTDSCFYHYGGITLENREMTDTTYDNYFWNDIDTNICVVNGDYYYLDLDKYLYLYKQDTTGNVSKVFSSSFTYVKMGITSSCTDENGDEYDVTRTDICSRLVYLDNRFYITSSKKIYSCYPSGKTYKRSEIASFDNYVVGLGVDNNELTYNLYQGYESVTLDKLEYFANNITTAKNVGYNNYVDINLDGYINGKDYAYITRG